MSDNKILFGMADPQHASATFLWYVQKHTLNTVLHPRRHEWSINKNFWQSSPSNMRLYCETKIHIYTIQWSMSVHGLHHDIFHAQFARHSIHYLYQCHAWTVDTETNQDSIYDIYDQSQYTVTTSAPILPVCPQKAEFMLTANNVLRYSWEIVHL